MQKPLCLMLGGVKDNYHHGQRAGQWTQSYNFNFPCSQIRFTTAWLLLPSNTGVRGLGFFVFFLMLLLLKFFWKDQSSSWLQQQSNFFFFRFYMKLLISRAIVSLIARLSAFKLDCTELSDPLPLISRQLMISLVLVHKCLLSNSPSTSHTQVQR